jgi:hypothetical protein
MAGNLPASVLNFSNLDQAVVLEVVLDLMLANLVMLG